jgi:thiosulfate/3-mercaptopyruvate sulfurtransferase
MEFSKKHPVSVKWHFLVLLMCLLAVSLWINSCGTATYDTPITPRTSATLLAPETLKTWIDSGIVNSTGYDKVIILDVTSLATYTVGHIPGAQFVNCNNDIYQVRQEGPAANGNMSIDGAHMDTLVQKYGIDKDTTIVFTSGATSPSAGSVLCATRAYWTFRYWGFAKEKLKLLDGINFAWNAAYGLAPGDPPTPTPSTYSVKNNAQLRTDLRASLGVMINVAEGKVANAVPVDMRTSETDGSYIGKRGQTPGMFNPTGDFVAFEGRLKGAKALNYTTMFDSANNYRFKSADVLAAMFTAIGIDKTKIAHVY